MKKDSSFKLRSGNKPSPMELSGVSPKNIKELIKNKEDFKKHIERGPFTPPKGKKPSDFNPKIGVSKPFKSPKEKEVFMRKAMEYLKTQNKK